LKGRSLRIAIVVHGRFHAFDLARELIRRGQDVRLLTNYPKLVAARFGVPADRVRSYLPHGILSRVSYRLLSARLYGRLEPALHAGFGRWAARQLAGEPWDAVIVFSGVAEEVFTSFQGTQTLRVLRRGSAHITTQRRILEEEEQRVGRAVERPSDWMVGREVREYALADSIHVLSGFALQSFVDAGLPADKLACLPLGVDLSRFRVAPEVLDRRRQRVESGQPLRVLSVGTFSCQKGAWDWARTVERLAGSRFEFRFVGAVAPDARHLAREIDGRAEFRRKVPQADLPAEYEWGDVFVLPTLQDGFAAVLTQALAAGLPLVTTPCCAGPDLIREGRNGWVVPVRDPEALAGRLDWLAGHRADLAAAVREVGTAEVRFDWSDSARLTEESLARALAAKAAGQGCAAGVLPCVAAGRG
jgi:glycosyltransferase involved in cell wall biosynthesis